jgi:hypothetical protein
MSGMPQPSAPLTPALGFERCPDGVYPSEARRRDANRVSFGLMIEERDGMMGGSEG